MGGPILLLSQRIKKRIGKPMIRRSIEKNLTSATPVNRDEGGSEREGKLEGENLGRRGGRRER